MTRIRVATADLPAMLDDIVAQILDTAEDIAVVGKSRGRADLIAVARSTHPDVVILGMSNGVEEPGWDLYHVDPRLRVLGLEVDGRTTYAYELRPHREPLGELSAGGLVDAVRRLASSRHDGRVGAR